MRSTFDDHHRTPDHNHFQQKTIYLPMFCRLSLKDIKPNSHHSHRTSTAGGEPSSPRVSCIGQVKRNNRVTGFPTTAHKHAKLKKNLAGGRSRSCRSSIGRENMIMCVNNSSSRRSRSKTCDHSNDGDRDCASVVEMDPPLPVVKKVAPPGNGRDEVNIWKRRFHGDLKSLRIQLPASKFQSPPTLL